MFAVFYSNDALITDLFWQHKVYKYPTKMVFRQDSKNIIETHTAGAVSEFRGKSQF
jgi:hypothetical protein